MTEFEDRFWTFVKRSDDCWFWTGHLGARGYGTIRYNGVRLKAHRVSWALHRGDIPIDIQVCHRCDVRSCVNPEHLFLGTGLDNIRDASQKGRLMHGIQQQRAKLTDQKVREARQAFTAGERLTHLARKYGVCHRTMKRVLDGERWRHVA